MRAGGLLRALSVVGTANALIPMATAVRPSMRAARVAQARTFRSTPMACNLGEIFGSVFGKAQAPAVSGSVFDYTVRGSSGSPVSLSSFSNKKALLIVNVASK